MKKRSSMGEKLSLLKSEKVRKKYFFETPFITIEKPRPLKIYATLLESELIKHGLFVSTPINQTKIIANERLIPFNYAFKADLKGKTQKDIWQVNFWLLVMGVISIILSIIAIFFTLRWLNISLLCFFIVQTFIALVNYIKALRKKESRDKFYQKRPLLIIETVINGLVLTFAISLLTILAANFLIGNWYPVVLGTIIILSSILVIMRCFKTFKIRRIFSFQEDLYLELLISFNGVIYQKACEQKETNNAELNQYQNLTTTPLLEIKFEICILDANDELINANLELIEEIKKSIQKVLLSKPVKLAGVKTTEQVIETTYLKNNEPRVFPLETKSISEIEYPQLDQG